MKRPPANPVLDQDSARATARFRADHKQETSGLQSAVDGLTGVVGLPGFVAALTAAILAWMAVNFLAGWAGLGPPDPPPFTWLQGALTMSALYVAALILTTQCRQDKLASQREQLTLELAILNDQKASKIIELLEEARRDSPALADRVDDEARLMSTPSDPQTVLYAIKDIQDLHD